MQTRRIIFFAAGLCLAAPAASIAQQPSRPAAPLDIGAIRKQAAHMAEVRGLLADPDPNVRLLAIREISGSPDPIERQLAIEAGLSSAETDMQEVALRAMLVDTQQIIIALSKADGSPISEGMTSLGLTVTKFDPNTGRISQDRLWSGQMQGAVFTFVTGGGMSGRLIWEPEAGEFRGTVNVNSNHSVEGIRKASWRPR